MGFKISRNTSLKCGKIVYVDMDNVLVDFQSGLDRVPEAVKSEYADDGTGKPHYDEIPGIFSLMDPMPGAIEAMQELNKFFDLYILSTAPWLNPSAWCDKLEWIQRYFGKGKDSIFYKRLIISHHKDLNRGDFLIDDREKNGAKDFKGELIQFGSSRFPDWPAVVKYLFNKIGIEVKNKTKDMTNEQIDEMLAEIGRAPLITSEEERMLLKAVKEKGTDCDEMMRLEAANMRFVVSLANQYQHCGLSLKELIEAATASLRNAAESYDLDSNCKFIAYAVTQMRQSIEQAIAEKARQNIVEGK